MISVSQFLSKGNFTMKSWIFTLKYIHTHLIACSGFWDCEWVTYLGEDGKSSKWRWERKWRIFTFPSERDHGAHCQPTHPTWPPPFHLHAHTTEKWHWAMSPAFYTELIDNASACHYLSCTSAGKSCTSQMKCGNVKLKQWRGTELCLADECKS